MMTFENSYLLRTSRTYIGSLHSFMINNKTTKKQYPITTGSLAKGEVCFNMKTLRKGYFNMKTLARRSACQYAIYM